MQAPILLAILEYGIVLALKMYWHGKSEVSLGEYKFNLAEVFKTLDVFTFLSATVVLSLFNIFYWTYYLSE